MASVTLHPDPQAFPIGTVVKVFALPSIPPPAGWVPSGAALTEPTVEQGEGGKQSVLTVTGLTVGKRYVGEAEVSGVRRTLTFSGGDEAAEGSGVTSVNGKSGAVTLAAADVEAVGTESPAFTGTPTAPTAAGTTNTTQIATTAFAKARATAAQEAAEAAAATAAAAKDATLKTEAETKIATAKSQAEAASRPAGAVVTRHRETISIPGTIANESLLVPMGIVSLGSGETQKAVKLQVKLQSGTKVKGKMRRKNGASAIEDLTGFTGVEATESISSKTPTAVTLNDGDELYFLIESAEGSCKGLGLTLDVDHSV